MSTLAFGGMGPFKASSWDVLRGGSGAGSCLGVVADAGEGLGGVPNAGSCLNVASSDASLVVMNFTEIASIFAPVRGRSKG